MYANASQWFSVIENNRLHLEIFLPSVNKINTPADAQELIQNAGFVWQRNLAFHFGVYKEERLIGYAGLERVQGHTQNLGFWLDRTFCRQGMMSFLLKTWVEYLFRQKLLQRVILNIHRDNIAARRLAENIAARCVNDMSPTLIYELVNCKPDA